MKIIMIIRNNVKNIPYDMQVTFRNQTYHSSCRLYYHITATNQLSYITATFSLMLLSMSYLSYLPMLIVIYKS